MSSSGNDSANPFYTDLVDPNFLQYPSSSAYNFYPNNTVQHGSPLHVAMLQDRVGDLDNQLQA